MINITKLIIPLLLISLAVSVKLSDVGINDWSK